MVRALAVVLAVLLLVGVAAAQPNQGFGPTYDPSNTALRVNVVAGSAGGLSPSTFGTAFPTQGAAVGGKDPNGAFASMTISASGRLQVTCDNCSSSAATFGTAYPSSGGAIGYKDSLGSFASVTGSNGGLNVNVLSGGGGSSNFGTGFPASGVAAGYKDANGAFASFSGANGKQNVIVGNESTLIATANQGSSATVANAWPIVNVSDAGLMVRAGDDVNKALRVNVVAGGTTNSTFGVAFPSTGIAGGYKDGNGALASFTGANGRLNVIVGNDSTLIATVTGSVTVSGTVTANQGASAVTSNAWPIVNVDDSGVMVRAGDASNKALRVNVVAGGASGGTSSTYGTAFPGTGTPGGGKDANGAFASFNLTNGRLQVTCDNCSSSANAFGTAYPANGDAVGYKDANGAFASVTGSNGGLNVNVLSGGGGSSTFGTGFPSSGVAGGYKDGNGAFASYTGANGKQNVIVGNESTLIATVTGSVSVSGTVTANQGASAVISNAWPIVIGTDSGIMVRPGDDVNKAMRVNVVAGGTTNSSFGTAFPSTGIAAGYKDANGSFASFTGSNGKQNVIVGNESTLIATANQGASASVANAWPVVNVDDSGIMVRAGDSTNKALRVNVVAGGSGGSTFGTAFPSTGTPGGYKDDFTGSFASFTGSNGAMGTILHDSTGRELGSSLPSKQNVPVAVQPVPQLPNGTIALGSRQTTIVNVPSGQPVSTPVRSMTVGGGLGTQGWATPYIRCDRTASISVTNSGMTQVVGAVNGQSIYVCGYTAVAGTTPVGIGFSYGTGTNCGTLSGDITGSMTVAASGGMVNANSPIPYFETPSSQALCVKLSNGAAVAGHLRYAQF